MTKIKKNDSQNIIKINAEGQTIGRLASHISHLLTGKNKANFYPNKIPDIKIIIENLSKIKFTGKKLEQKKYFNFTGYPGGVKSEKLKNFFAKDPKKLFIKVIYNMLPKNRLSKYMIKKLLIKQ